MKNPYAAMRKRLAAMPPEILDALRQDQPPIESRSALLRRRLARCGRGGVGLCWTEGGFMAKHTLHKIDKEKA